MKTEDRTGGPIDVRQACERNSDAMFGACLRILRNHDDAQDATQETIAHVIANPPKVVVADWPAYLCRAAQNTARQHLRRHGGARQTVSLPDDLPSADTGEDERQVEIRRLLGRVTALMTPAEQDDFELYREVALTSCTQKELVAKRHLTLREVQRRRKKALRTFREATIAVRLAEDPGSGSARCVLPMGLAQGEEDSPGLREKIMNHVRGCRVCKRRRAVPKDLLRKLLVVPGLGLAGGLLARLVELCTPKKVAVAATTALAVVTVAVLVENEQSAPPEPVVVLPSGTVQRPLPVAPPLAPPPLAPVPPPELPPPAPEAPPAPVPVPPAPVPVPRDDSPPAIAGGWVEHRRLVVDEYGRCDDEPRTSGVAAVVHAPGGVRSVTLHLRDDGRDIPIAMTPVDGPAWVARIGPFDDSPGRYDVVVEAVGVDGTAAEKEIAELCVTRCGGRAS